MVPDATSDEDEDEEEDIEELRLTGKRLDEAPEHLKQIPIVDMIDLACECYQTEIYDQNHGVAKNGNNVDVIMDGDNESRNPARDLSIDAKPARHARGVVSPTPPSSETQTNQELAVGSTSYV